MIAASQNPNMRSRVVNSNMGTMNNNMMMSSCSSSSQYHNRNCQNPSVVSATNDIFEAGLAAYAGVEQFGSSGGVPTTMSDLFDGALFDDELDGTFCVAITVWIVLHLIGFMIQRQQHKFSPFFVYRLPSLFHILLDIPSMSTNFAPLMAEQIPMILPVPQAAQAQTAQTSPSRTFMDILPAGPSVVSVSNPPSPPAGHNSNHSAFVPLVHPTIMNHQDTKKRGHEQQWQQLQVPDHHKRSKFSATVSIASSGNGSAGANPMAFQYAPPMKQLPSTFQVNGIGSMPSSAHHSSSPNKQRNNSAKNNNGIDTSTNHIKALTGANGPAVCFDVIEKALQQHTGSGGKDASSSTVSSLSNDASAAEAALAALSPEEKAKQSRDRNRQHARNTRVRKKAYVEELKRTLNQCKLSKRACQS